MVSEPIVCPNVSDVPGSLIVLCLYILSGADGCSDVHVYEHTCGSQDNFGCPYTSSDLGGFLRSHLSFQNAILHMLIYSCLGVCYMYVCIRVSACACNYVCMP